jgi:hypothetical protein
VIIRAEDANLAWYGERQAAARAGIPFQGFYGAGEYRARAFVSLDGKMVDVEADENGDPIDDGGEDWRTYVAKLKAVKNLFGKADEAGA